MPRWPPNSTDFTVSVVPNVRCNTSYSYIPKPILSKLGNPKRIQFSIKDNTVIVTAEN